jgi:hypothetical protein
MGDLTEARSVNTGISMGPMIKTAMNFPGFDCGGYLNA